MLSIPAIFIVEILGIDVPGHVTGDVRRAGSECIRIYMTAIELPVQRKGRINARTEHSGFHFVSPERLLPSSN